MLLAKNLFELREYKKCSHILKDYRSVYPNNQSLIFYYCYSLWMSGLIRKEEEIYENCKSSAMQKEQTSLPSTPRSTTWRESSRSFTMLTPSTASTSICMASCSTSRRGRRKLARCSSSPSTISPTTGRAGFSFVRSSNQKTW